MKIEKNNLLGTGQPYDYWVIDIWQEKSKNIIIKIITQKDSPTSCNGSPITILQRELGSSMLL
jgi:hypothetical protein